MSSFFRSTPTPSASTSSSSLSPPRVKEVLTTPNLKAAPVRPPPLQDDHHLELYSSLLAYVSDEGFEVGVGIGKEEKRGLSAAERMWLTSECLER